MGIRIDGASDQISASDGSLTIEGQSVNTTGIVTASGGIKVGTAATIHSTGQFNIGVAATIFANGNATYSGIVTAASYIGDGSALTGIAGTEITNSDFAVGVSTFFADYSTGRAGIGTIVPAGLLHVKAGPSGSTYSANAADTLILERNAACVVDIRSTATTEGGFVFSDQNARAVGRILYNHTNDSINFTTDSAERLTIRGDGRVSIASSLAVAGVCTATSFSGDGSGLTGVSAGEFFGNSVGVSTTKNVGIQTSNVNTEKIVGAANSFIGLYMGDGFIGFPTALNRDGGYFIATTVNAFNAGPVTLGSTMVLHGTWTIV